ncbi:MAG: type II toxin-antitoxin system VapC family toxin [Actinomycetota bacterium]|nr:type II toxin-antitoxin system VapC family toxin [Actinomycetota bacterium]
MTRRFLYDTGVFVYAAGADHPYREPCRRLVKLAGRRSLVGDASVELVHELVHVLARRSGDRAGAVARGKAVFALCRVHEEQPSDLRLALGLFAAHEALDLRDALFAATALNRDIHAIVSPDRSFDGVGGLERIDPVDAESRLG